MLFLAVGVPDPLGQIRQPRLASTSLQVADEVTITELLHPAEDLPLDADEQPSAVVAGGNRSETVADSHKGAREALQLRPWRWCWRLQSVTQLPPGYGIRLVRVARGPLVGPRLQDKLDQEIGTHHRAPSRPHELGCVGTCLSIAVPVRRRHEEHIRVTEAAQEAPDLRSVLAETARPFR